MVSRTVDDLLQGMSGDHVRIMDLFGDKRSITFMPSQLSKPEILARMVQKLTNTNRPMKRNLCMGKMYGKMW